MMEDRDAYLVPMAEDDTSSGLAIASILAVTLVAATVILYLLFLR